MRKIIPTILIFTTLAGIVGPASVTVAPHALPTIHIQTVRAETKTAPQSSNTDPNAALTDAFGCGFFGGNGIGGCLSWLFYFIPYTVGGFLMWLSALVFDHAASLTLSSSAYSAADFVREGWRVTRDISNIFFILVLLYIALAFILDLNVGHGGPKKMIASVVIIALTINFSLFITQVIIDTSNTLALVFYNQITVRYQKNGQDVPQTALSKERLEKIGPGEVETKELSTALVQAFQPSKLQDPGFFQKLQDKETKQVPIFVMITLLIVIGGMFVVVAWSLFKTALAFIGRMIELWVLIIFAPIAFITYIVPGMQHYEVFGWSNWWKRLFETAFSAPIYFFLLLIISLLAQSSFISTDAAQDGPWMTLLTVVISFLVLIILLNKATKYVEKASGEIGQMATKLAGQGAAFVGGAAIGIASGGLAWAGRTAIGGRAAQKLANPQFQEAIKDKISKGGVGGWIAKQQLKTLDKATKSSFDLRQNNVAAAVSKSTGMNFNNLAFGNLSTKKTAGGFQGEVARRDAENMRMKELLGYNKVEKKALEDAKGAREGEVEQKETSIARARASAATADSALKTAKAELDSARAMADGEAKRTRLATAESAFKEAQTAANDTRKQVADLGTELSELKNGKPKEERNAIGKPLKDAKGNFMLDNAGNQIIADRKNPEHMKMVMADMGIKDLERAAKNVEMDRFNQYLLAKAQRSGYSAHAETDDSLGYLKKFHIDTREAVRSNWNKAVTDGLKKAGTAAAIGSVIAGPMGAAAGAVGGLMVQAVREAVENGLSLKTVGARRADAEAIHHSSELDHKVHTFESNYKGPASFVDALMKLVGGSGGGGGHGGGGGSHGGGHGGGHDSGGHGSGGHGGH